MYNTMLSTARDTLTHDTTSQQPILNTLKQQTHSHHHHISTIEHNTKARDIHTQHHLSTIIDHTRARRDTQRYTTHQSQPHWTHLNQRHTHHTTSQNHWMHLSEQETHTTTSQQTIEHILTRGNNIITTQPPTNHTEQTQPTLIMIIMKQPFSWDIASNNNTLFKTLRNLTELLLQNELPPPETTNSTQFCDN